MMWLCSNKTLFTDNEVWIPYSFQKSWSIMLLLIFFNHLKCESGTSLVVQWLRIRLPMQRTWVRSLVREDPTCCGATKPVRHNYWDYALEPASPDYWAHAPQVLKPTRPRARVPQLLSLRPATTEARTSRARALQ